MEPSAKERARMKLASETMSKLIKLGLLPSTSTEEEYIQNWEKVYELLDFMQALILDAEAAQ